MKIGVLSCYSNPLLPLLLKQLNKNKLYTIFVILDEKDFSQNQKNLWKKRTGKKFLANLSIYNLKNKSTPFYFVQNHNSPACIKLLIKLRPSILINGGTPRKLSQKILKVAKKGILNVHPGILPKYRGADCVEWSIFNNDPVGNTAHIMTMAYDQGPIIKKTVIPVCRKDSYQKIRRKTYLAWSVLVCQAVLSIFKKNTKINHKNFKKSKHIFKPMPRHKFKVVLNKIKSERYWKQLK